MLSFTTVYTMQHDNSLRIAYMSSSFVPIRSARSTAKSSASKRGPQDDAVDLERPQLQKL